MNTEAPAGRTSSRTKTKLSIDRFQGCLRDPSSQGASILRPVHWGAILVHGLWEIQNWRWVRRLLEDADVQDPELAVGRSGKPGDLVGVPQIVNMPTRWPAYGGASRPHLQDGAVSLGPRAGHA